MPIEIGALNVFRVGKAKSRRREALFEIFEAFARTHLTYSKDIRADFLDDVDHRVDLAFWLGVCAISLTRSGRRFVQIISNIVLANDKLARCGSRGTERYEEEQECE